LFAAESFAALGLLQRFESETGRKPRQQKIFNRIARRMFLHQLVGQKVLRR
jgi:hypothetical protein